MGNAQRQVFFPEFRGMNSGRKALSASESPDAKNWFHINGMIDVHGPRLASMPAITESFGYPVRNIWRWVGADGRITSLATTSQGGYTEILQPEFGSSWHPTTQGSIGTTTDNPANYLSSSAYFEGTLAATPYTEAQLTDYVEPKPYNTYIEFATSSIVWYCYPGEANPYPHNGFWQSNWTATLYANFLTGRINLGSMTHTATDNTVTLTLSTTKFRLPVLPEVHDLRLETGLLGLNYSIEPSTNWTAWYGSIGPDTTPNVRFIRE